MYLAYFYATANLYCPKAHTCTDDFPIIWFVKKVASGLLRADLKPYGSKILLPPLFQIKSMPCRSDACVGHSARIRQIPDILFAPRNLHANAE